jgi:YbbR domain-containing protein
VIEIKKRLLNNIEIKILALAMAIILWFYISSEYNITAERYYDIEVRPINLTDNLSIKEIREKISVGIEGPKNILENLSSQKIVGTVDLQNIEDPGEYQIEANVIVPKNTNITKIIHNEIIVEIEEILERKFQVEYNLIGLPASGYSLEDEPHIVPQQVAIVGPNSLLEQIEQVRIDIDISSVKENIKTENIVSIYDKNGEEIKNLSVEPNTVSVSIKVGEGYPEKILPIKPRIVGKPAPEYYISKIVANPSYIKVYGNYSKIGKLDFLETIPIDVNGISKTLTVKIPPIISEGIYISNEQESLIEVQILVMEKQEECIFKNISITRRDASPFIDYQLSPETVDIKVSGSHTIINSMTEDDIKVFVNLLDLEIGKVKVEVELPSEITLIQVIPEEVNVTIKK